MADLGAGTWMELHLVGQDNGDALLLDVVTSAPIRPYPLTDGETLTAPTFAYHTYNGDYGSGVYGEGVYQAIFYAPDTITDAETLGTPTLSFGIPAINPDGITDAETLGAPAVLQNYDVNPQGVTDTETVGTPSATVNMVAAVTSITDPETLATPDATLGMGFTPDGHIDGEAFGGATLTYAPHPPFPDTLTDPETLSGPAVRFNPSHIYPDTLTDPQTIGAPTWSLAPWYNGTYGSGYYGVGPYQGLFFSPLGIVDIDFVGTPSIPSVPAVPPDQILPLGIVDGEQFGTPTLNRPGATNARYGEGTYGDGIYVGAAPPLANFGYGSGQYGNGLYYGILVPQPPDPDDPPLFGDVMGPSRPPLHILGIGPWGPHVHWRGAPNYGVPSGTRPPHPVMALPPTTSKSFTLRLGEGGEARLELSFPRGSAVILDEMDTDLWWRRKDPRVQQTEVIGRFNVSHLNIGTSDTGVSCSVQLDDWQTVLGARMVLKYLSPKAIPPTSMWNTGTPVISIIAWALPTNTGLDLSEATGAHPTNIGNLIQPFDLPPGTTMNELFANLLTITDRHWEWWIDAPDDVTKAPKLRFIVGERGSDRGVTLFDVGKGPTPIASWTRNSAQSDYANSLYYTGGVMSGQTTAGGVVEQIDAQISQYGQRDHTASNSSVNGGDKNVLHQHASKVLAKLADRRPNYTIALRQGFWRGRSHIDIGDTVELILRLGKDLIEEKYRVSEITVNIDDLGLEEVTLNLGRLPVSTDPRSQRSPLIRIINYLRNYETPAGSMYPQPD